MSKHIYAYAAFINVGHRAIVQTLNIIAPSRTIAQAIADREATAQARHIAQAEQIISGESVQFDAQAIRL